MFIHRSIGWRDLYPIFADAAITSAVIMVILGFAGIFAYCINTLGVADPLGRWFGATGLGPLGTLIVVLVALKLIGIFLDGVSLVMVFVPLLVPLMRAFGWDPVWFGVLLTMVIALGQFTPPLAVNLLVACRLAEVPIEKTVPWVGWFFLSFALAVVAVIAYSPLALWLPRALGY
jgi:TRAP-type C4-dicarboxylate transport system permease large subunit